VRARLSKAPKFNLCGLDFCSSYVLLKDMSDRPASWRIPTPKQMEKLASKPSQPPIPAPGPADDLPEAYWDSIIRDPRGQIRTGVPIQQRRLSEIPRHVLKLLDNGCQERTGRLEEDGCWPSFETT
jgi:hypothetical protein